MYSPKITNDALPFFCLGTIRLVLTYNMLFLRSTFTKGGALYGQLIFGLSFHLAVYAQMEFYFWFDTINVGWLIVEFFNQNCISFSEVIDSRCS